MWVFPKNCGTPKSSILIGFSIIFTIHFGVPLFLEFHPCVTFPLLKANTFFNNLRNDFTSGFTTGLRWDLSWQKFTPPTNETNVPPEKGPFLKEIYKYHLLTINFHVHGVVKADGYRHSRKVAKSKGPWYSAIHGSCTIDTFQVLYMICANLGKGSCIPKGINKLNPPTAFILIWFSSLGGASTHMAAWLQNACNKSIFRKGPSSQS